MLSVLSKEEVETVHSYLNTSSEEVVDSLLNTDKLLRASIALKVAIENDQKYNPDQHFVDRYTSLQWLERMDAMSREQLGDVLLGADGLAPYVAGHISS